MSLNLLDAVSHLQPTVRSKWQLQKAEQFHAFTYGTFN